MKKHILNSSLLFVLMLCWSPIVKAQEAKEEPDSTKLWKTSGTFGLTFSNVSLNNWAGGGESSISLGILSNYKAVREGDKGVWTNQIDFAYGLLRQKGNETFRKTDDQLIILSQYGYKINNKWLVSALFNFRSQVAKGYQYAVDVNGDETRIKISNFLSPGFITVNTGITYKEKDVFSATLAPFTVKSTLVMDDEIDETSYGLQAGKSIRSEIGWNFLASFNKKVMQNVNFTSSLSLFSGYETLSAIDVNWETLLAMKVNKYITTSFGTQLIYDEDIKIDGANSKVQFKHVLNVGFGVTF